MSIKDFKSGSDVAAFQTMMAQAVAAADMALENARAHAAHNNRLNHLAEQRMMSGTLVIGEQRQDHECNCPTQLDLILELAKVFGK